MNNKLGAYLSCLLCGLLLYSCTNRPKGVLSKQEMEDALYDVYLAQALIQTTPRYANPEAKDSLLAGVLAKNQITQAQFDSSIVWYSLQGETYFKINDRVSKRLKDLQRKIGTDEGSIQKLRKKYDGFTLPPSVTLGGHDGISLFTFKIDSVKFGEIDTTAFDFNFKTLGILPKSDVTASVRFEYRDTIINRTTILSRNSYYSIQLPQGKKRHLRTISGYIKVNNSLNVFPPVFFYDLRYKKIIPKPKPIPPPPGRKNVKSLSKPSHESRPD